MKEKEVKLFPFTVKSLIFLHTLFILLFFYTSIVTACTVGSMSDAFALKVHDTVFTGKLVGCFPDKNNYYLKFEVHRIWKGSIQKTYTSQTDQCEVDTPYDDIGREVIVFANKIKDSSHINIPSSWCSSFIRPLVPFEQRYLFGFALPDMFIYEGTPTDSL